MIKLSNSYILSLVTTLMILLVVAKSVSLALWWVLPSDGVSFHEQNNYKPKYQKVDFNNMIDSPLNETVVSKPIVKESTGISITNMILKGLYGVGSKGVAILALKSSPKNTSIVSVGEDFSGYRLKTILSDGVVFTKNDKDYILKMEMEDATKKSAKPFVKPINQSKYSPSEKLVSRQDINYYAKNPDKIWKDISIVQMKNNKGDIMIRANNNDLKSYKDAIDLYKNMDKLQVVQLVVLRNNEEKEFVYEIN